MKSNKQLIWIVLAIVALISGGILIAQFVLSGDLFGNKYIANNTAKAVLTDQVVSIGNLNAKILVPRGFAADFTNARSDRYIGTIKNNDVTYEIVYKSIARLGGDSVVNTGGGGFFDIKLEQGTKQDINTYNKVTESIFRPKTINREDQLLQLQARYIEIIATDPTLIQDDTSPLASYTLSLLAKDTVRATGIEFTVLFDDLTISEQKIDSYLQLGDKILTSIQAQ
jgi:hypothetical protein